MKTSALIAAALCLLAACSDDDGTHQNDNLNNTVVGVCGNGEREGAEECDNGSANSDTIPDACRTDCSTAQCGDGVLDTDEECDDGPANSDAVPDACRAGCTPPRCGDGVVDVQRGESCDDGNAVNGDGCNGTCVVEYCGNGFLDPGEQCDDGNYAPGDGCGPRCQHEVCGNGFYDPGEACEDANHASHDGCSSGCTRESPIWRAWSPSPSARQSAIGAYHESLGALVLFGGSGPSGYLSDTWAFDGGHWHDLVPGDHPQPLARPAVAYDAQRARLLLYGGNLFVNNAPQFDTWAFDGVGWGRLTPTEHPPTSTGRMVYDSLRDRMVWFDEHHTWAFDGTDWAEIATAHAPPARNGHVMVYDSVRDRVVLYGGSVSGTPASDTWEFDGTDWTENTTAGSPTGSRWDLQLAYDPLRQRVVLFGGLLAGLRSHETWEYDGATWSQMSPTQSPEARTGHVLVFHEGLGVVVATHGFGVTSWLDDTWRYDGTTWTRIPLPDAPGGNLSGALAMDPLRGEGLALGAFNNATQTWLRIDEAWELASPSHQPPPRSEYALVFDSARERFVLFGGVSGSLSTYHQDTWEFDGTDWTEVTAAHLPPARRSHQMVYDSARGVTVLFGGVQHAFVALADTWEFDGTDWTEVTAAPAPEARYGHGLAFDAQRGVVVLYGGFVPGTQFADTWEFDGSVWNERPTVVRPLARDGMAMAYHAGIGRVVLHGGGPDMGAPFTDTWEYDGTNWLLVFNDSDAPTGRGGLSFAWDGLRRRLAFLVGGSGLWFYRYGSEWGDEVCWNGIDDDGDAQEDCTDPDCEGHPCGAGQTCTAGSCQ